MSKPLHLRLKQRWLPFIYGYLVKVLLKILGTTCRFEITGEKLFLEYASKRSVILTLWHNRIVMLSEILKRSALRLNYAALISKSRDGEIIATFIRSFPNGKAIRVAHNARSKAIEAMINELRENRSVLIITPDGPRGPKYKVKSGVCRVATTTQTPVFPISWQASAYWQLGSWDGLIIPKPFATIYAKFAKPVLLNGDNPGEDAAGILEKSLLTSK